MPVRVKTITTVDEKLEVLRGVCTLLQVAVTALATLEMGRSRRMTLNSSLRETTLRMLEDCLGVLAEAQVVDGKAEQN